MFYLTSKFHDNCINTFGFMERAFEAPPPGTPKKPRRNKFGWINLKFNREMWKNINCALAVILVFLLSNYLEMLESFQKQYNTL